VSGRASRDKGIRWERAVAHFLGTTTTRSTRPGVADDAADVVLDGWLVECKDHARWSIPAWWHDLDNKVIDERPVLVLKRRNRPVGDALVVLRLEDWNDMRRRSWE